MRSTNTSGVSSVIVVRFPSYDRARAFYTSALYEHARAEREGATDVFNMVVVEGV